MSTPQDFDDEWGEQPDSYLDRVDGHWYVVRYDRTAPQIHADDCEKCASPLSFDDAERIGLDGTGRDGDPRFPYTYGDLTDAERYEFDVTR